MVGWAPDKEQFFICLSMHVNIEEIMEAFLVIHHTYYHFQFQNTVICETRMREQLKLSLIWAKRHRETFIEELKKKAWDLGALFWGDRGIRSDWKFHQHQI
jgi:hypothetical protein